MLNEREARAAAGILFLFAVEVMKLLQSPAVQFRHIFFRNRICFCEIMQIPQQVTECIADTAIDIDMAFQDALSDTDVFGIVRANNPKTDNIRAKFLRQFQRRHPVSTGFGHFISFFIQQETMCQNGLIRCNAICTTGHQQ